METAKTAGIVMVNLGLAAAFVGLAVFGVVLVGMALSLPGAILKRIAVAVLGVGGIVIGGGYLRQILRRLGDWPFAP